MKKVNKIIKEELFSLLKEVYTGTGSIDLTPANQGQIQALKNAIFDLIDDRDKLKKRVEKLESLVLGKLETDPQMQRLLPPEETKTMAIRRKVAEGKSTIKITKEQLTQIIKETVSDRFALGKGSNMADMMRARQKAEMELKNQAEMDGRADGFAGTQDKYNFWKNEGEVYLKYYMIGLSDAQDEQEYYGDDLEENKMKITKEQLTQIIKEEIANVLNERHADDWDGDSPSYPGALEPPTISPSYMGSVPKKDLCGGWEKTYYNPEALPADRDFVLSKAKKNGCEWSDNIKEQ